MMEKTLKEKLFEDVDWNLVKKKVLQILMFIERHDNVFCIILFFLSIFGVTLNVYTINSDELWNFQNAFKLYNGFKLYKDINAIITPLFFWLAEIFFKIIGANFFGFRVFNIVTITLLYFVTYLLLKELKMSRLLSIIIVWANMLWTDYCTILCQANYNTLVLLFYLFGVLLLLKRCKYNSLWQGIILFLIFCTKQNVAVFYAIALFIVSLCREDNFRQKFKNIAIQYSVFLVLLLGLVLYFYKNGILYDFFNMAVLSVGEFALTNFSKKNLYIVIMISFFVVNFVFALTYMKYKLVDKKDRFNLIICNCFSIMLMFMVMPIINQVHVVVSTYLAVIVFVYEVGILYRIIGINLNILGRIIIPIVFVVLTVNVISNSFEQFSTWKLLTSNDWYKKDEYKPFYGAIIKNNEMKSIEKVYDFIKNNSNDVVVLSDRAAFYMIATRRNNGIMDLPFRGNLGKDGEEGLIEKIKGLCNTDILIVKDKSKMHWQESKKVREYIVNNLEKVGEIEYFMIYRNK